MEKKFKFIKSIKNLNFNKISVIVEILTAILGIIGVLYIYKKATDKYYDTWFRKEYGDDEFE